MIQWTNYFVRSLAATARDGHLPADKLREAIAHHDGTEAYHCAYDLEAREDFSSYQGVMRPALGYVWFDFDSSDGGLSAHADARRFVERLQCDSLFICYSGSKGFHVGVPFSAFGLEESQDLCKKLHAIAAGLKKEFGSLDTTIYNANRKFRALGSRHPKTGRYKVSLSIEEFGLSLDFIKRIAESRGSLTIPPAPVVKSCELLQVVSPTATKELKPKEPKAFTAPTGKAAFAQCGFLKFVSEEQNKVSEPQWYAALSIVSRFQDGRKQCHGISHKHAGYSVGECNKKIDQALEESAPRTCTNVATLWDGCSSCPLYGKVNSPVNLQETKFWGINKEGKQYPQYKELVEEYDKQTQYFIDPVLDRVYNWTTTHYEDVTDTHVNAWCENTMEPSPSSRVVNEFRAKVRRTNIKSTEELRTLFFDTTQGKLNLKNGTLDIETGTLSSHKPTLGFRYVLPYSYDASATAPKFQKFLNEVTLGREELQQTLLEFMGYCLWPRYDDHCFLWLSGTGRNGKSTFMEIVQELVGESNASSVSLNQFEKSNYLQLIDHMLVNISEESDMPKISPEITGPLKALSAGSKIQVDQKFEKGYSMRSTAKLIFAANKPPLFAGTESALKSRLIVVPFELQLEDHSPDSTVSRIDWKIIDEIKSEMPGILNLCLSALKNFVRRSPRKIHRSKISHHASNEIMRDSDPVEAWVQDYIEYLPLPTAGDGIAVSELHAHFMECQSGDYQLEMHWFARRLKTALGNRSTNKRQLIGDRRTTMFFGICPNFKPRF